MRSGKAGSGFFRSEDTSPSDSSFFARLATCILSLPSPASSSENASKFMRPFAAYSVKRPVASTRLPTCRSNPQDAYLLFHIMQGSAALLSLTVK